MRYSRQRELVFNQVMSRYDHPTADEIYTALRQECPGLSLGTVYRNLNGLVEMGKIRRVCIAGQADRFDRTLEEHHHLYCRKCGRVVDVELDTEALRTAWTVCKGAVVEGYNISLAGLCPVCGKTEQHESM